MTKQQLTNELIACLRQAQELGGRELPLVLEDTMCPMESLVGFDSLVAEEVISWLEERLGHELPHHAKLFLNEGRPINIGEISGRLSDIITAA